MRAGRIKEMIQDRILVHAAYDRLFSLPDGEVVLRHVIRNGFVLKSTFVAGDPEQTALNEGSRRLALSILKFAKRDHQKLIKQLEQEISENE